MEKTGKSWIHAWKPKTFNNKTFDQEIKKYSHFQTVTTNTFPEFISNDTFSESCWQKILHTFLEFILTNTDIFRDFLPN